MGLALVVAVLLSTTLIAAYTPLTERHITTDVVIEAPAAVIWDVLVDLGAYSEWNPFFRQASGRVAAGERLKLESETLTFTPTVLEVREYRRLRWLGRLGIPGIFDGEHSFTLTPLADERTRVVQHEIFRGVLIPFAGSLLRDTESGFIALGKALKKRAEARQTRAD